MAAQPYTQAHNFFSAVSGGVDPRTGLFMFNFPINNFHGNNTLGPVFPLALSYCPLDSENDYQLGTGITLGVSSYNSLTRNLNLSSGERFKVVDNDDGSQPVIRQQKIDSVHFNKNAKGYTITHKSGMVEVLEEIRSGIYLPVTLRSPMGYYVELNWQTSPWNTKLLDITDSRGKTLCIFTYETQKAEIVLWPDTAEEQTILLEMENDYLTTIRNTSITPELQWQLEWDNDTLIHEKNVLKKVTSPTKLIQEVEYTNGLMKYVIDDVQGDYPAVTTYTQYTADSTHMLPVYQTFSYSTESNYLGYGETYSSFAEDDDNLYGILNPYDYSSVQTLKGDGKDIPARMIERHYNNFHLLVSEKHTQSDNANVVLATTDYYAVIGETFDKQPNTFQLPKQQSTSWTSGSASRKETTTFVYDTYGNITSKVTPDGTETTWTWYPAAGAENLCPQEPNGFTRFMRQQQVTPPADKYQDTPVLKTEYQYLRQDSWKNTAPGYAVLQSQVTHSADDAVLSVEKFTYAAAADYETGRMQSQTVDVHGSDEKIYTHSKVFTFSADYTAGTLAQQVQTETHDKLTLSHKRVQSVHSGQLLSTTDAAGNTVKLEYDAVGRLMTQIHHPDKPDYTAKESWDYLLNPCAKGLPQVVHTDILGNQKRTTSDPLGRTLIGELYDRDHELGWTPFQQHSYDLQGRCFESKYADTLTTQGEGSAELITQTITRSWDNWGQLDAEYSKDEKLSGHSMTDPVLLTATQWTTGDNAVQSTRQVAYHDPLSKLPVKSELLTLKGEVYSTIRQDWDAGRRLRQHTDENGRVTRYNYDVYGRVIKTTLPDGSVIEKQYAPFSSSALPVQISITAPGDEKATVLGTQHFDGLGRLTQTQNGGRTYRYVYLHAWQQHPSSVTAPDGAVQTFSNDPALGEIPVAVLATREGADNITKSFHWNTGTGQLDSASEGSSTSSEWSYFPSGRVKDTTVDILSGGDKTSSVNYSLLGSLQSFKDIGGEQQLRHYSAQGYLYNISTDDLTVDLHYDDLKRLASWTATNRVTNEKVTTTLTRDEQGRESLRKMEYGNGDVRVIKQFWEVNHQLAARQHELGIHTELAEYFTYDSRNRLVDYRCEGTRLPQLESGETFSHQHFTFDALSNIVSCETRLTSEKLHTTTYLFENKDDPCQLTGLKTAIGDAEPTTISLKYDACGRMTQDQAARVMTYDALGRLLSIQGASQYSYDAHNTLVSQKITESDETHRLYYMASQLVNEWITAGDGKQDAAKDKNISLRYAAGGNVAEVRQDKGDTEVKMITTDAKQSVVTVEEDQVITYTPYGVSDNGKRLEDDADKVTSVAAFHLEYRDNSARGAVLYSNGWNQAPAQVRLLLWDKDNQPVKLSQDELLKDNRLKFFLKDDTPLAMKPVSDQNAELTYWNVAGDYDKVVQYNPSIRFIKPTVRSLAVFNTVELEVLAASPDATPLKKLVVSYSIDGNESEITSLNIDTARIHWADTWCLPAGEITLKATATDSKGLEIVTTHTLSIPVPKDKAWVFINAPKNNATFTPDEKLTVNVSYQAHENQKLSRVGLEIDNKNMEMFSTDKTFDNRSFTVTMTDYPLKLMGVLFTADGYGQTHPISIAPQAKTHQADSALTLDENESVVVVYFATAETGATYEFYAKLDLPNVSDSTKQREQLDITTWESINYSEVTDWQFQAMNTTERKYFKGNDWWPKECFYASQEFRFTYVKAHPAFVLIKNTGTLWPGGYLHEKPLTWFDPGPDVSSLLWHYSGNEAGGNVDINTWCVLEKPYASWGNNVGYRTNNNQWVLKTDNEEYGYAFAMPTENYVVDTAIAPYDYVSVYRSQICTPELWYNAHPWYWDSVHNDSQVFVADVYGNHGTINIQYKSDSFTPIFPPK